MARDTENRNRLIIRATGYRCKKQVRNKGQTGRRGNEETDKARATWKLWDGLGKLGNKQHIVTEENRNTDTKPEP